MKVQIYYQIPCVILLNLVTVLQCHPLPNCQTKILYPICRIPSNLSLSSHTAHDLLSLALLWDVLGQFVAFAEIRPQS